MSNIYNENEVVETKENELTEEALNELSHNKGDENSWVTVN